MWASYAVLVITGAVTVALIRWTSLLQGFNRIAALRRYETVSGAIRMAGAIALLLIGNGILALTVLGLGVTVMQYVFVRREALLALALEVKGFDQTAVGFDTALFQNLWPSTMENGPALVWFIHGELRLRDSRFSGRRYGRHCRLPCHIESGDPNQANRSDAAVCQIAGSVQALCAVSHPGCQNISGPAIASSLLLIVGAFVGLGGIGNLLFAALQFNIRLLAGTAYLLLCVTVVLKCIIRCILRFTWRPMTSRLYSHH